MKYSITKIKNHMKKWGFVVETVIAEKDGNPFMVFKHKSLQFEESGGPVLVSIPLKEDMPSLEELGSDIILGAFECGKIDHAKTIQKTLYNISHGIPITLSK